MEKDIITALRKKGYSEEQISKAIGLLDRQEKQKVDRTAKAKERMNDPAYKAKMKTQYQRRAAKNKLLIKKALEAGILVSDAEVDAELAT